MLVSVVVVPFKLSLNVRRAYLRIFRAQQASHLNGQLLVM